MPWDTIRKISAVGMPEVGGVPPNLGDYAAAREAFRWGDARAQLDGLPGGGLNIAHEAVDRHVRRGHGDRLAIRWLGKDGTRRDITYAALGRLSARFAGVLRDRGVVRGARVFVLAGRIPALYVAILGALRHGCVVSPLFSAFGPEPVRARMTLGDARVLVTTEAFYRRKVMAWRAELPQLAHVLLADASDAPPPGTAALEPALEAAGDSAAMAPTSPEDPALLHFTSGTTPPASSRSTSIPATGCGARPIPAGSPACPTA